MTDSFDCTNKELSIWRTIGHKLLNLRCCKSLKDYLGLTLSSFLSLRCSFSWIHGTAILLLWVGLDGGGRVAITLGGIFGNSDGGTGRHTDINSDINRPLI